MNTTSPFHNLFYVKELVFLSMLLIIMGKHYNKNSILFSGFVLLLFCVYFFRNYLKIKKNSMYFLSPSSSKIINVDEKYDKIIIQTYLSPLDKHFMIAPVDCTIVDIMYKPILKSDSERLRVTFKDIHGQFFFLDQIVSKFGKGAWLLKFLYSNRCIVFYDIGTELKQGDRYGLIRFGSNMQYIIPQSYKIMKAVNSHVQIGEPIAAIK